MREEAVRLGRNQLLVGVLTSPDQPTDMPTVLMLNAGMTHHVGPSRIYVRLARRFAELGMSSLRFDFSGIGDSGVRTDNLRIEEALMDDVRQAMDDLYARFGQERFILVGHCGGGWVAFVTAGADERVVGAVLLNPEGIEEEWVEYDRQRKVSRYYQNYYGKEALLDSHRWKKLLTGQADYKSIAGNVVNGILRNKLSAMSFKLRQQSAAPAEASNPSQPSLWTTAAEGILQRQTRVLLAFSKGSSSIDHAHMVLGKELSRMEEANILTETVVSNADHTFTLLDGQQRLFEQIELWLRNFAHTPAQVR